MKVPISNAAKLKELDRLERLEMGVLVRSPYPSEVVKSKYRASCPLEPTLFLPGSLDKVEVMRVRVSLGYSPFHPLDARFCTK